MFEFELEPLGVDGEAVFAVLLVVTLVEEADEELEQTGEGGVNLSWAGFTFKPNWCCWR